MKFQYSRSCSMWMILALGCFVYFFFVRNMWIENEILFHNKIFPCNWQSGDPILYNLRASPHVNFEGNHWFHVAENFMVEHSILRADGNFQDASEVYFHMAKSNLFVSFKFCLILLFRWICLRDECHD
jgi:hypothetical protein